MFTSLCILYLNIPLLNQLGKCAFSLKTRTENNIWLMFICHTHLQFICMYVCVCVFLYIYMCVCVRQVIGKRLDENKL